MAAIGVLIVVAASINFINLMTARAGRRATEVGIRKVAGATRRDLMTQFVGESILYVTVSAILALAMAELALPSLDAFMNAQIAFDWWRQPALIAMIAGLIVSVGLLAGAYPAFVMSSFKPASVLKDGGLPVSGAIPLRQALVVFAVRNIDCPDRCDLRRFTPDRLCAEGWNASEYRSSADGGFDRKLRRLP